MPIKQVSENAYFVTDVSAYYTQLGRYDPLTANQTLISSAVEEDEAEDMLVIEDVADLERLCACYPPTAI